MNRGCDIACGVDTRKEPDDFQKQLCERCRGDDPIVAADVPDAEEGETD